MILITGCPSSGLSLLANYFYLCGYTSAQNANPENFFLDPECVAINEELMQNHKKMNGRKLKKSQTRYSSATLYRISSFFCKNPDMQFLLDPRFVFTHPAWSQVENDIDLIICFRHPLECANSLAKSRGLTTWQGLKKWHEYYSPIVNVPAAFIESGSEIDHYDYLENLKRLLSFLDLDINLKVFQALYSKQRFHSLPNGSIPSDIYILYQKLQRRTEN